MKRMIWLTNVKILLLVSLTACLAVGCRSLSGNEIVPSAPASLPPPSSQTPIVLGDGVRASYADVVERVAPAVVNIVVIKREAADENGQNPLLDDPRFRDFQKQLPQGGRSQIVRGAGSGVIVNSDGTILTNHHVVEGASDIEIQLNDKRSFKAKLVGSDEPSDVAVLKVESNNLPFLNLGDSDKTRVGDVVLALGNPLGIGQTVTLGIISAKGRRGIGDGSSFEDFLQTDAPINRGNSGGALVNLTGELIGINSQILSSGGGGGSIGIGFAIPSNMARSVIGQLIKNGKVRRGQLGVEIRDITSDLAASLNLKETRGAVVTNVRAGSAAEKAGVKRYDVVTALNGERVEDGNTLRNHIASTAPGSEITLTVNRDGKEQQFRATLGELSAETAANRLEQQNPRGDEPAPPGEQSGKLGLGLQPLTPELARQLQIQADGGLVVTEVDPAGPAADAGIRNDDAILEVNRQSINSFDDFRAAIEKSGDRPVLLFIARKGQTIFLTVSPRKQ